VFALEGHPFMTMTIGGWCSATPGSFLSARRWEWRLVPDPLHQIFGVR
jgi:hypothetical protein